MSQSKDLKSKAGGSKVEKIATASIRDIQPSSQVWGDDEDYDSEEGDEEFGLSSDSKQMNARNAQN